MITICNGSHSFEVGDRIIQHLGTRYLRARIKKGCNKGKRRTQLVQRCKRFTVVERTSETMLNLITWIDQ